MTDLLRRLADKRRSDSIATRLRRRRFQLFHELLSAVNKRPVKVLDVGATIGCRATLDYLHRGQGVEWTLLNLEEMESPSPHVATVVGDARDMREFRDGEFDFVFSNSVIEHVGNFADQKRMANEVRRVGNGYFVQTPNLYFPLEPHFLFPCFQFLPLCVRTHLLKHFRLGWHGPIKDVPEARKTAASVRLLRKSEVARLFPDGRIVEERFLGLVKSFVVFRPHVLQARQGGPAFRSGRDA